MRSKTVHALSFEPFLVSATTRIRLRREFRERGVAVIGEPAMQTTTWLALVEEACVQRGQGAWHLESSYNLGEISQDNRRGYLGPCARGLLEDPRTCALLHAVTGRRLMPSWSASCYTYYDVPGSYMGEHCDKFEACRIALLIYLEAHWPAGSHPGPGLGLHIFLGDSSASPLVARVTAHSNRVVILNGAEQAHVRPPLAFGESLLMLAGCYQLAGPK